MTLNRHGLNVRIKWTKTNQKAMQALVIPIPKLKDRQLDPVKSYRKMVAKIPAAPNAPLFSLPNGDPMTVKQFRKVLKGKLQDVGYSTSNFSAHSLRRGACSLAFLQGASVIDIKKQGTWTSNCVEQYIVTHPHKSSVCKVFKKVAK